MVEEHQKHTMAEESAYLLSSQISIEGGESFGRVSATGTPSSTGRRKRWVETRPRREPTLYDEYLVQDKQLHTPRRSSTQLFPHSPANVDFAVSNDRPAPRSAAGDDNDGGDEGASGDITKPRMNAEYGGGRVTSPSPEIVAQVQTQTNSQTGAAFASTTSSPPHNIPTSLATKRSSVMLSAKPIRSEPKASRQPSRPEQEQSATAGHRQPSREPDMSRTGSLGEADPRSMLGASLTHSTSTSEVRERRRHIVDETRPRTRTLDDHHRRLSPSARPNDTRQRGSSLTTPTFSPDQEAEISLQGPASPLPNSLSESVPPTTRGDQAKRILHLMRTLQGRMGGVVYLRRQASEAWKTYRCFVQEYTGALMCEVPGGHGTQRAVVPDLRRCALRPRIEGDSPYLEITITQLDSEIHFKPQTQTDFDHWYAAFLHWLDPDNTKASRPPSSIADESERKSDLPFHSGTRTQSRQSHNSQSAHNERRRSELNSLKEAPVIKIGNMIYWEGQVDAPVQKSVSHGRHQGRTHSIRSPRWRRISGQLRENGELKLHADTDNSLLSVVQLSQLSRCAIQRLHHSVMDIDFCIAIYPQYTSSPSEQQPGFVRPVFLSLEDRVLYEVWFVLLRAFTIPQLYGSRMPVADDHDEGNAEDPEYGDDGQDLEEMLATSTMDVFRMERTLTISIVEAKMYPGVGAIPAETHSGRSNAKHDQFGYYAEILLDSEFRGKTAVKFKTPNPIWQDSFEFADLPPVLNNASVVIRRRPQDPQSEKLGHDGKHGRDFTSDLYGRLGNTVADVTCGKVEIYLHELEDDHEIEKWWPVINSNEEHVGEVLIKAHAEESVILMARDYEPLFELLHRVNNGLTLQIAQAVPNELKRISDCLLNIFQASGHAGEWLMALIEDEIDGVNKETHAQRLRYSRRAGSDAHTDALASATAGERELIVRDMNKTATLEANLLFRGNTLLTKALDSHMRRVGKEYLEESLAAKLKEINEKDPDCEVDPNRVPNTQDLDRNWRRLLLFTQEVWNTISNARHSCPFELRLLFKHIRACAEDRYGDFLRSVSFSSVSGFLFLRFFCPAILNPVLFGLVKAEIQPRARRTFVLIAKSLQTLANLASFGTKETWMAPMNAFLTQHRENFKTFINDICYVHSPIPPPFRPESPMGASAALTGVVSADKHLSYTTPMTIMQRLPPTSREGFPSLPYLIDSARAYAELVNIWLEATSKIVQRSEGSQTTQQLVRLLSPSPTSEGELLRFHEVCTSIHERTQECLNRADRAERPGSPISFQWDQMIDQLQPSSSDGEHGSAGVDQKDLERFAERVANDTSAIPSSPVRGLPDARVTRDETDDSRFYNTAAPTAPALPVTLNNPPSSAIELLTRHPRERPWSAGRTALRDSLRKARSQSRASASRSRPSSAAGASNASSAPSSDTERNSSVPSIQRREQRREVAMRTLLHTRAQKPQDEQATLAGDDDSGLQGGRGNTDGDREDKPRRRVKAPIVSALRRTRQREQESRGGGTNAGNAAASGTAGPTSGSSAPRMGAYNGRGIRGVDMSFV